MTEFIRRPDRATGGITPEEKIKLDAVAQEWIGIAMRTDPIDPSKIVPAIEAMYAAAGLKKPRVVIVPSPLVMAFAYGAAAWVWHQRKEGKADSDARRYKHSTSVRDTVEKTLFDTRAAGDHAVDLPTCDNLYHATQGLTENSVVQATSAATFDATYYATFEAARRGTAISTDATTGNSTFYRAATCGELSTYTTTRKAIVAAIHGAEDSDPVLQAAKAAHDFGGPEALECAKQWSRVYQGGNMWAGWCAYLVAFRDVLGLRLKEHEAFAHYEQAAREGGFRVMHEEFCMVSDFPLLLKKDEQDRPHCSDGPSHKWRDGWSLYHWHGVRIPKHVIERPETITIEEIKEEKNAEVRRVMILRYGHERYVRDAKLRVVDTCAHDHPLAGLRTARLYSDGFVTLLDMLNSTPEPDGTIKRYILAVDPAAYNGRASREVLAAMASTWRKRSDPRELVFASPEHYAPMVES